LYINIRTMVAMLIKRVIAQPITVFQYIKAPAPTSSTSKLPIALLYQKSKMPFTDPSRTESSPDKSINESIQAGIDYATSRLLSTSRTPSPTVRKALAEYALACQDSLEDESPQNLPAAIICKTEHDFCQKTLLLPLNEESERALAISLQEQRRCELFARYGEHMDQICGRLNIATTKQQPSQWEPELAGCHQKWKSISEKLKMHQNGRSTAIST
jgi:hypothetical protein